MIKLWRALGKPASGALAISLLLSALAALFGIALLGLSGWFLSASAVAGIGGVVAAFNHLMPSTGVRTFAVGRVAARYAEQLVGHEATLSISAALRPMLFERMARNQEGVAALPAGELSAITDDVDAAEGSFLRVAAPLFAVGAGLLVAIGWAAAVDPLAAGFVALMFAGSALVLPRLLLRGSNAQALALADEQAKVRSDIAAVVENAIEMEIGGVLGVAMERSVAGLHGNAERLDGLQRPFFAVAAAISFSGGLVAIVLVGWAMAARLDTAIAAGAALAGLAAFEAAAASARSLDASSRAQASIARLLARLDQSGVAEHADGLVVESVLPLRLQNLQVQVGKSIIGPVSLDCRAGNIVEISGRSGVGKSTLLEAIAALRAASGVLLYDRCDAHDVRPASVLARVGLAPQFPDFLPGSLRDQIAYGRPDAPDDDIAAALEIAAMTDAVGPRKDADANSFSGGERRRLGLARALTARPQLLLLDEPFAGLEDELAQALRRNLARWVAEGDRAIIFTSHRTGPDWGEHSLRRVRWPEAASVDQSSMAD